MKKFLKSLLGDIFLREILFAAGNKLITVFFIWLLSKLHDKFGERLWYYELSHYLMGIQIEDFFNDNKKEIESIKLNP